MMPASFPSRFLAFSVSDRIVPRLLAVIIVLAILIRVAAFFVLRQPLTSDPLAYFTMAKSLVERGELVDVFGQHVFYSAGYPLLLAPFFALLGSSVSVALFVNILLCAITVVLVYALAHSLSQNKGAGLLAALVYALWLPGIWNATMLAKENLSTPLALGLAICAVGIGRNDRPKTNGLIAGLLWGASLVTGGSSLLFCFGVGIALLLLWRARGRFTPALTGGLCFIVGASLVLAPWLYSTKQMVGRPVLTTNAAFNLYLGNNPAATGRFVSIADTPAGEGWETTRLKLGEVGVADHLQDEALRWISKNPGRAAELAALKLAYFWFPNVPDATDFAMSRVTATIRLGEVIQYGLILVCGLMAFRSRLIARGDKAVIGALILGFWLIHAVAYIIPRYRDPVIPLLIVLGTIPIAAWLERRSTGKRSGHGA